MKKLLKGPIQTEELTVIPKNTKLEGIIEATGTVIVYASYRGTIKYDVFEVGRDAKVNASVESGNATVGGVFEGEMVCNGHLGITSTARVKGRISSGSLSVESGGLLDCSFSSLESEDTKLLRLH